MVFLHFLVKFPAWVRAVHMLSFVEGGPFRWVWSSFFHFLAAPLYNLNKTKQLRLTKVLFESASHFVPRLWYNKNGPPIMNSKSAAWIQPPGGCGLIGWSRAYQKVRPDLCRRGPITPSQKRPTKKSRGPLC